MNQGNERSEKDVAKMFASMLAVPRLRSNCPASYLLSPATLLAIHSFAALK